MIKHYFVGMPRQNPRLVDRIIAVHCYSKTKKIWTILLDKYCFENLNLSEIITKSQKINRLKISIIISKILEVDCEVRNAAELPKSKL